MDNTLISLENMEINTLRFKVANKLMKNTEKPLKKASKMKSGMITQKSSTLPVKKF